MNMFQWEYLLFKSVPIKFAKTEEEFFFTVDQYIDYDISAYTSIYCS